jgi:hypothetical protein
MMNDPAILEASRVSASKLWLEDGTVAEKITKAFILILCPRPKEKGKDLLIGYYRTRQEAINETNAAELLAFGV